MSHKKGFTLIELIIVIALIALLATTVILVINPVKIFKEARDSQRIADLGQMNSAMSLLLATDSVTFQNSDLGLCSTKCYAHGVTGAMNNGCGRYSGALAPVTSTSQVVDGNGWIPVKLTNAANGAPISAWPIDPKPINTGVTTTSYFYSYACDTSDKWEFTAHMESTRYASSGTDDVESTDGGNLTGLFEVGTGTSSL